VKASRSSQLSKWTFNLVSSYDFTDGALKGLGVGGAYRWQDKSIIGFYPRYSEQFKVWMEDLDNPIFADAQSNIDLWASYKRKLTDKIDWRVQLNIRNAFSSDKLVPTAANPDGSYRSFRIASGRTFEITNSFSF
jgi:hypothetical protein